MQTYRVIQTKDAFQYPAGKVWGPYIEEIDAQQRLATLRSFDGDGVIEHGEFGTPCGEARVPSAPLEPLLAAA